MRVLPFFLVVVFVCSFVAAVFVSSSLPLFSKAYYRFEASRNSLQDTTDAFQVIDYLHGSRQMNSSIFSQKEISHMADVKRFYERLQIVWMLAAFIVIISGALLYRQSQKAFFKALKYAAISTLLISLCFVFGALFFESTFERFHLLFFQPGSYVFSESELLPRLFPEKFFYDAFVSIIFLSSLVAILALFVTYIQKRKK